MKKSTYKGKNINLGTLTDAHHAANLCVRERVEEIADQIPPDGQYSFQVLKNWTIKTYEVSRRTAERYVHKAINRWRAQQPNLSLEERRRVYVEVLDQVILDEGSHSRDKVKAIACACNLIPGLRVPQVKDITVKGDQQAPVVMRHMQELFLTSPDVVRLMGQLDSAMATGDRSSQASLPPVVVQKSGRPDDPDELPVRPLAAFDDVASDADLDRIIEECTAEPNNVHSS